MVLKTMLYIANVEGIDYKAYFIKKNKMVITNGNSLIDNFNLHSSILKIIINETLFF
jgi:hypothetical protein